MVVKQCIMQITTGTVGAGCILAGALMFQATRAISGERYLTVQGFLHRSMNYYVLLVSHPKIHKTAHSKQRSHDVFPKLMTASQ